MTDEEMAEEYAKGLCTTCTLYTCRYSKIKTCAIKESIKQACLAGLKVGRPKWHKVADGDLPKHEKDVQVLYQDCDKVNSYTCLYDIHGECWLYYNLDNMLLEPFDYRIIAWCEIPRYTEE